MIGLRIIVLHAGVIAPKAGDGLLLRSIPKLGINCIRFLSGRTSRDQHYSWLGVHPHGHMYTI